MNARMKKLIVGAAGIAMLAGCSESHNGKSATTAPTAEPAPAAAPVVATDTVETTPPSPAKTTPASGEVKDAILRLERVHFARDSSTLTTEAQQPLEQAAPVLKKHDLVIHIVGHADKRGTDDYNMELGKARAQAVYDYLVKHGVSPEKLRMSSVGEDEPMASGSSRMGRAKNRNVGFRVHRGDVELIVEPGTKLSDDGEPMQE